MGDSRGEERRLLRVYEDALDNHGWGKHLRTPRCLTPSSLDDSLGSDGPYFHDWMYASPLYDSSERVTLPMYEITDNAINVPYFSSIVRRNLSFGTQLSSVPHAPIKHVDRLHVLTPHLAADPAAVFNHASNFEPIHPSTSRH